MAEMKCPHCDNEIQMQDSKNDFWGYLGCLPAALGVAIIIWAFSGFPGLN